MTPTLTITAEEVAGVGVLRDLLDGEVFTPADAEWDEARLAWNLAADQHPAAVVYAESAADVAAVVRFARENGLHVTTQGTGHFANTIASFDETILLKTSRLRDLEIDPEARIARAEAGVLWQEVSLAAAEHGLAGLAGSAGDVGVVGYTLGGGLGWLARRYGLAANSVVAVELVTADGRHVRTDRDNEPDLFWAVRGGGGSFGIVTAIEFALYPVAEVYAGVLFFPFERSAEILNAWREWVEDTPREVTSAGRLMQFPPIPQLPEALRGQSFVIVEAALHRLRGGRRRAPAAAPRAGPGDGHVRDDPLRGSPAPAHGSAAARPGCRRRHDPRRPDARDHQRAGRGRGPVLGLPARLGGAPPARRRRRGRVARARRGRCDRRRLRPLRGRYGRER